MTYATKSPKKIAGLQQNAKKGVRANFASPEVARLLPRWLRAAGQRVKRVEGFFWTRNCFKERSEFGNEFRVSIKSHSSSHRLFFAAEVWDGRAARFCRVGWGSGPLMRYLLNLTNVGNGIARMGY